jgi:hypothetical protein
LENVEVHLVAVEVRVVGFAVGVVHPEGGLFGQHFDPVCHEAGFVEGGLSVEEHTVTIEEVSVDNFILVVNEEVTGVGESLLRSEKLQLV